MRWIVIMAGLLTNVGCQGPYSPFSAYGPTQVPPPPTGSANRADPYYRRSFAGDDRLSQRWFNSDQNASTMGMADRRADPGFNDGAARISDSGIGISGLGTPSEFGANPSPTLGSVPEFGSSPRPSFGSAPLDRLARDGADGYAAPGLDARDYGRNAANSSPLRASPDLGWRRPEPASDAYQNNSYVEPAAGQSRIPRPRFNY